MFGGDDDVVQACPMKESGELAPDPALGDVITEALEDPPGQPAAGSVNGGSSPVGVQHEDAPTRPGHPDHLSQCPQRVREVLKDSLSSAGVKATGGKG